MNLRVKYFDKSVEGIEVIEKGDWIDLRSRKTIEYEEGDFFLIPLNVAIELPEGFEAHILPRSSTFKKWGLIQTNSQGVIDNSFSGEKDEYMLPVIALRDGKVEKGDRICQFRLFRTMESFRDIHGKGLNIVEVESLDNENRGGFGSTGIK